MSKSRMDVERRREEAQRMRANQAQLASRSQSENLPDEPLFDAPRKIDQSDGSSKKIKEIFGKWNDITWVSGMPVKTIPKPDAGMPASVPHSTDHSSSTHPPRINGQHKHQLHIKTEPPAQDHRHEAAHEYGSSSMTGNSSSASRHQIDNSWSRNDEKHKGEMKTSIGHTSPTPSRPHTGTSSAGGVQQILSTKQNQTNEHSGAFSLSVSPKNRHLGSVLPLQGKIKKESPLRSQDRGTDLSNPGLSVLAKVTVSSSQSSSSACESHTARSSTTSSRIPGFGCSDPKSKSSANRCQSRTPPPVYHTPPTSVHRKTPPPVHRTPPPVSRSSASVHRTSPSVNTPPLQPVSVGDTDNSNRSPSSRSQARAKHLTLQIKQEQPVNFKDLNNIFEEMIVRSPHTAIQTPVKTSVNRFPFSGSRLEDSDANKHKALTQTGKGVSGSKCKEDPLPIPEESKSVLEEDLAVSDSEDNNEAEENPETELSTAQPAKKGTISSSNESSSDSESSSDDSSDSDTSSSGDENEEEAVEKKEKVKEEVKKEEPEQNPWNLKNFMVAKPSPPVPTQSGGQIAAEGGQPKPSNDVDVDVAGIKVSPRKMADIGPCASMPFMPHEDLDSILRNSEKASSPDAPSTASSTASSQHLTRMAQSKTQAFPDSLQVSDKVKTGSSPQSNIKSGPGRPKSVSNDRTSSGSTVAKRKGSSRDETASVSASERKRKRKDSASSAKVKESRPPLVRTSSSSDVDIESVTPDPKANQAASVMSKEDKLPEELESVSKQLFLSPLSSPQTHSTDKSDPPVKSKSHHRTDHNTSAEKPSKQPLSAAGSHVKSSSRKTSSGGSLSHIDNIMAEMKEEFKLPAMLSPTEPHRSPSSHDKDSRVPEVPVGYSSTHVPTSTCGKPSIVVRIVPSKLRSGPSTRKMSRTSGSKQGAAASVPSVLGDCPSQSVGNRVVTAGAHSPLPGACDKLAGDQTRNVSPVPSNSSSPARLSTAKHGKDHDLAVGMKKAKASCPQPYKSSGKSSSESVQNGLLHTDVVKKTTKRTSERRGSGGSNRSSKRPKQDLQSPKPLEVSEQNGVDSSLPFSSTATPSPADSAVSTHTANTCQDAAPDPLMPVEDRLEPPDFYLLRAKELKHTADKVEKPYKLVPYIKSILYFIMWGYSMEKQNHSEPSRVSSLYADTCQLLQYVSRFRNLNAAGGNQDWELVERDKKLSVLILRMQSLLNLKMFSLKKKEAMKFKKIIEQEYKSPSLKISAHAPSPHQNNWNKSSTGIPSPMSPTPSPTCSIGSVGSQGSCEQSSSKPANGSVGGSTAAMSSPGTVTVPQRIHSVTQKYMAVTAHLVQAHDLWEQSDTEALANKEFFGNIDNRCGPLSLHSSMLQLVVYVSSVLKEMGCS